VTEYDYVKGRLEEPTIVYPLFVTSPGFSFLNACVIGYKYIY
jgi:hypothetical protein